MAARARVRRSLARALAGAAVALAIPLIGGPAVAATAPSGPPWYFTGFDMNDVWKVTSGGQVVVGVVAGGVGSPSGMLQNALMPGGDVSSDGGTGNTADVLSAYDGTQVAALIAAKSTSPVQGMAPGASILPVRDIAKGEQMSDAAETARGIKYAADHGASVILVVDTAPRMDGAVGDAVTYARGKDAIVVAPSGNTGQAGNNVNTMCSFSGVVCVGATQKDGTRWPNSASSAKVDLAAPGVQVTVPTPSGATRLGSSTHYSAALVAAEAALIRSAHPTWTAGQIVRVMIQNTDGGKADHSRATDNVGYGIIKPLAAVKAPQPSSTTDPLAPASPHPSTAPSAPHQQSSTPAAASGSSGGSGSGTILLIVGAAVGGLVIIGLVVWLVLRGRNARGGNYLTDPAYRAGYYYEQDSGPTSQLGGYQGWNAQQQPPFPPGQTPPPPQGPPFAPPPAPPPPQTRTPQTQMPQTQTQAPQTQPLQPPQPFQHEPAPPPYWPSQPMQPRPAQPESAPPQPAQPQSAQPGQTPPPSEPELGAGYTQAFAGEPPPAAPPAEQEEPEDSQASHDPEPSPGSDS